VLSIDNTSGNNLTYYTEHGDEGSPSRELYLETRCIAIWPRSLKFSSTHSKQPIVESGGQQMAVSPTEAYLRAVGATLNV
jgi:hypothetical protein